jgi:small subunit ribosomal protein S12
MSTFRQLVRFPRRKKPHFTLSKLLVGAPFKKGVCLRVSEVKPKKPNSANRKVAKVRLRTGRSLLAAVPGFGHNLAEHSVVLVRGGKVPDLPGVRYRLVRGVYDFSNRENSYRSSRRSKFSVPKQPTRVGLLIGIQCEKERFFTVGFIRGLCLRW